EIHNTIFSKFIFQYILNDTRFSRIILQGRITRQIVDFYRRTISIRYSINNPVNIFLLLISYTLIKSSYGSFQSCSIRNYIDSIPCLEYANSYYSRLQWVRFTTDYFLQSDRKSVV